MKIENCTTADIPEIFRLYKIASDYQRTKKTVVVWPEFKRELVETEIAENRQWKLILDDEVACVWATTFTDEEIWEERNTDPLFISTALLPIPIFVGKILFRLLQNGQRIIQRIWINNLYASIRWAIM